MPRPDTERSGFDRGNHYFHRSLLPGSDGHPDFLVRERLRLITIGKQNASCQFTIYDMMGRMVRLIPDSFEEKIFWDTMAQNGSAVPTGMYGFMARKGTSSVRGIVRVVR